MELGSFIYWLLIVMGVVFVGTAVMALYYISRKLRFARVYHELADSAESAFSENSKKSTKILSKRTALESNIITHFKKESITRGEKYVFEETI